MNRNNNDKTTYPYPNPQPTPIMSSVHVAKSRGLYIMLGLLFGWLGVHNLYAGHIRRGIAQFITSTIGFVLAWVGTAAIAFLLLRIGASMPLAFGPAFVPAYILGVWIWVITDLITINRDGSGVPFS